MSNLFELFLPSYKLLFTFCCFFSFKDVAYHLKSTTVPDISLKHHIDPMSDIHAMLASRWSDHAKDDVKKVWDGRRPGEFLSAEVSQLEKI